MHNDNYDKTERLAWVTESLIFDTLKNYKNAKDSYFYASSLGGLAFLTLLILAFMWLSEYPFSFSETAFPIVLSLIVLTNYIYMWSRLRFSKCALQSYIFKLENIGLTLTVESRATGSRIQTTLITPPEVNRLPVEIYSRKRKTRLDWAQFDELITRKL